MNLCLEADIMVTDACAKFQSNSMNRNRDLTVARKTLTKALRRRRRPGDRKSPPILRIVELKMMILHIRKLNHAVKAKLISGLLVGNNR